MAKVPDAVSGARMVGARMADMEAQQARDEGRMPLMEHVRELRNRVLKALLAIVLGTGIGLLPWCFNEIWTIVERPYKNALQGICRNPVHRTACQGAGFHLIINGIFDSFTLRIELAFIFAIILTSPIWLYQLWAFIAPGLDKRERRYAYVFVSVAVPLFVGGAVLAYLVMGRGLTFLLGLAPQNVTVLPPVNTYLGYVMAMVLGFGATFELPLILVLLSYARILPHSRFRKWRRGMIFAVFVFAGIATPSPDPLTMLLLAGPCVVLVEVAEVIIWAHSRTLARRDAPFENLADQEPAPLSDLYASADDED